MNHARFRTRAIPGLVTASLAITAAARAQDTPENPPAVVQSLDDPKMYQIKIEPRLWYISPSGDVTLPGSPANTPSVSLDTLNMDSPRLSPSGDATIRFGRWSVNLSGAATSSDRSTVAQAAGQIGGFSFNPGDPIRTSFDFATGEASVGYSLGTWAISKRSNGSFGMVADLSVLGGLRVYDLEIGVGATTPNTARADEFFLEPIAGGRLEMEFAKDFSIDVQTTFGYMPADRESSSWDIRLAFSWRPVENLGVQLGYRNMFMTLETGDGAERFEFDGGVAGLFAGIQIRF